MSLSKKIYTLDEIKNISKPIFEHNDFVDKAYLFGSYARKEANETSDLDFMIVLAKPVGLEFFGLYEFLQTKFKKKVDVITENEAKTIMPKTIERDKVLIYERTLINCK